MCHTNGALTLSAQGSGVPERTDPWLTWPLLGYITKSLEHRSRLQWLHSKAVPVVTTITFIQSIVVCWQFPHESYRVTGLHPVHKYDILKIAWGPCHTVHAAIAATGTKHNAVSTPLLGSRPQPGVQNVHRNKYSHCRQKPCAFCFLSQNGRQALLTRRGQTVQIRPASACFLPDLGPKDPRSFFFFFIPSFSLNCSSLRRNGWTVWPVSNTCLWSN